MHIFHKTSPDDDVGVELTRKWRRKPTILGRVCDTCVMFTWGIPSLYAPIAWEAPVHRVQIWYINHYVNLLNQPTFLSS